MPKNIDHPLAALAWPMGQRPMASQARSLCDALAQRDVWPSSPGSLLLAQPLVSDAGGVFLALEDARASDVEALLIEASASGYATLLGVSAQELDEPGRLRASWLGLVFGLGGVVASAGESGQPLVGMELGALRRELERSRHRLSERCGYEVTTLWPRQDRLGRAMDGLVAREAARAGYARCVSVSPLWGVLSGVLSGAAADPPLVMRPVLGDRSPQELARWASERTARERAQGALDAARHWGRRALGGEAS